MRRFLLAVIAAVCIFSTPEGSAAQEKEFRGRITDDMCGATHMMEGMTDKECADECVKGGAKYALYLAAQEKLYALDKQAEAEKYSAEAVVVRGSIGPDGKSIVVKSIEKDQAAKKPE
jgi:hypothetical protein